MPSRTHTANRQKKRKRKIHVQHLLLVIFTVTAILALIIGIPVYRSYKTQQARQELLASVLEQRQQYEASVASAAYTGSDEEAKENVEIIRTWAADLNEKTYTDIESLRGENIDDEQAALLESLDPQTEGQDYLTILNGASQIDPYWLRFLAKDADRLDFVSNYFNQSAFQTPPATLSESLDSVPALLQWDERWGYIPYGDMIIAFSGCAPTTISMAASYLNQDPSITPPVVAAFAEQSGDYVIGAGTAYTIFEHAAAEYGLQVEGIPVDLDSIEQAVSEGKVLIAHAVPGKFTSIGHFMVITGVEDGKIIVNDPNSIKNTQTKWDPQEMLSEFDIIWGYSK